MTRVLQPSLQWYLPYSRHRPKKKSVNRLYHKEMRSTVHNGPLLRHENPPLQLFQFFPQGWTFEDHTLNKVSNSEEKTR